MGKTSGTIYYTLDGSDPRLPGGSVSPTAQIYLGSTVTTTILPDHSVWKILDNGSNQGTAWYGTGFSDAAWKSGSAELGYGDGGEVTTVGTIGYRSQYGRRATYATTYFRRTFTVDDPSQLTAFTLELVRDDGAVVYINGQEARRINMPDGAVTYQTWSSAVVGGTDEAPSSPIPWIPRCSTQARTSSPSRSTSATTAAPTSVSICV